MLALKHVLTSSKHNIQLRLLGKQFFIFGHELCFGQTKIRWKVWGTWMFTKLLFNLTIYPSTLTRPRQPVRPTQRESRHSVKLCTFAFPALSGAHLPAQWWYDMDIYKKYSKKFLHLQVRMQETTWVFLHQHVVVVFLNPWKTTWHCGLKHTVHSSTNIRLSNSRAWNSDTYSRGLNVTTGSHYHL